MSPLASWAVIGSLVLFAVFAVLEVRRARREIERLRR